MTYLYHLTGRNIDALEFTKTAKAQYDIDIDATIDANIIVSSDTALNQDALNNLQILAGQLQL